MGPVELWQSADPEICWHQRPRQWQCTANVMSTGLLTANHRVAIQTGLLAAKLTRIPSINKFTTASESSGTLSDHQTLLPTRRPEFGASAGYCNIYSLHLDVTRTLRESQSRQVVLGHRDLRRALFVRGKERCEGIKFSPRRTPTGSCATRCRGSSRMHMSPERYAASSTQVSGALCSMLVLRL